MYLFADYAVDVEALRAELPRILARTPLWDGQTQNVQVTDATDRAVQIRALVSARDSGSLWDLRCFVREALVAYLRNHQPAVLPRVHVESGDRDTPKNGSANGRDGARERVAEARAGFAGTISSEREG